MNDGFDAHRAHLRAVAERVLGSGADADDAVQEAWLRFDRADLSGVENVGGWLTTVVARVALDMLRAKARRPAAVADVDTDVTAAAGDDPEHEAVLADSVGAALNVVLETLSPAERIAFVLHDSFAVPFEDIAEILGRSPNAAKQLAYRARTKVQAGRPPADRAADSAVVDAFLAASRAGDFEALVSLLDPEVALDADAAAVRMGSPAELRGATAVAGMFSGRAQGAQPAFIDGGVGLAWAVDGRVKVAWDFAVRDGRVVHVDMLAAAETLDGLDLTLMEATG